VDVRRIGVTPDQVLDHLPDSVRQEYPNCPDWWPLDRIGDAWLLPTAEALLDVMPGILRDALDVLLPDADKRKARIAAEKRKRRSTATALLRLLAKKTGE
jgi:hypothetical protein